MITILRELMSYCSGDRESGSVPGWPATGATRLRTPDLPHFLMFMMTIGRSELQDRRQLAQVADLVGRPGNPRRQRLAVAVDPHRIHADLLGAQHVHVGAVAHEERLLRPYAQATQRRVEDVAPGLAPADLVGDDDRLEQLDDAGSLENVQSRRRVVEVRDDRQPISFGQPAQERTVVWRKLGGPSERGPVRVDQGAAEARGQ